MHLCVQIMKNIFYVDSDAMRAGTCLARLPEEVCEVTVIARVDNVTFGCLAQCGSIGSIAGADQCPAQSETSHVGQRNDF